MAVDFPVEAEALLSLLLSLDTTGLRNVLPLRPTRSAISMLASVVSLGSPGSVAVAAAWLELARWRLGGGWVPLAEESDFLWPEPRGIVDSGAVVSPSSAEASRDSAWMIWSVSISMDSPEAEAECGGATADVRFRLPAICDDELGDDMMG
jgi:hypothetical protein